MLSAIEGSLVFLTRSDGQHAPKSCYLWRIIFMRALQRDEEIYVRPRQFSSSAMIGGRPAARSRPARVHPKLLRCHRMLSQIDPPATNGSA